jgi:DNA-binding MarR family transcriptional regulator
MWFANIVVAVFFLGTTLVGALGAAHDGAAPARRRAGREGVGSHALSRHIAVLEQAGLVKVEKGFEGKRPRTWVQSTRRGRTALEAEMTALRELIARVDGGSPA